MIIGIPKEIMPNENRVAAIPETVAKFVRLGYEVHVEQNAGRGAYHKDAAYAEAGAKIVGDAGSLYANADVVLKVKEPMLNIEYGKHEIDLMRPGTVLIAFLHPQRREIMRWSQNFAIKTSPLYHGRNSAYLKGSADGRANVHEHDNRI